MFVFGREVGTVNSSKEDIITFIKTHPDGGVHRLTIKFLTELFSSLMFE